MNYPRVSIVILNWNGLDDTIECLESLKKITYHDYEVIVVDNGSQGSDAQALEEKFGEYINLQLCCASHNPERVFLCPQASVSSAGQHPIL